MNYNRYIYERKFLQYLLVVLLAYMCHTTAIIMLPVFFIVSKRITGKSILMSIIVIIGMRYGYDTFFGVMSFIHGTDQTVYSYMQQEVNPLRVLVAFVPVVLILIVNKHSFFSDDDSQFYFMLTIINFCMLLATSNSAYLARIGIYTEVFTALSLPRLVMVLERQSRRIFIVVTLLLYGVYWAYELNARNLVPYVWVFTK